MVASGGNGLKVTVDTGVTSLNFSQALTGPIGPFLFQLNPPPQITALTPPVPPPFNRPADWLGDGATPATFIGSPTGFNGFMLEAFTDSLTKAPMNLWPSFPVGGTTNKIVTDLGVISGHRYHFPPITGAYDLLLLD